jgi:predicted transposase YbfD/YdcC
MGAESKFRLVDVWVGVRDPRQTTKVEHDLIELLVVSVSAVLSGADTFVEIEAWAKEKLEWLRQYLKLEQGIPSHDTFGRVFAAIDPDEFGAAFVRWVGQVLPVLAHGDVVAIDGKTSRRSGKVGATPLHLVSAFAAQAGVVLGQRATAEKSNEKTAIPELLATLALQGSIVTIDAMGTQPNIAQAIRDRGADYLLAVKDNQPRLAESIDDFFGAFEAAPAKTPHQFHEVIDLESHPPFPGQAQGRPQGSAPHRRHLRYLPRRTPRSSIRFMQLPCAKCRTRVWLPARAFGEYYSGCRYNMPNVRGSQSVISGT